jgi:TonB family protein
VDVASELSPLVAYKLVIYSFGPPIAKAFRIEGQVVLEVTVGQDGRVSGVRPQSGGPLLVEAAEEAVRQWRYAPSSRLPAGLTVAFEFQLAEADAEQTKLERSDAGHSADLVMGFTKYASEYPEEALRQGIEGEVLLEVVTDVDGGVVDIRVLKSDNALLTEAALEVARKPSPDGDRTPFHWKPGSNTMVVDFQLDEPRSLTAETPVAAVGYLTSAPPGMLISNNEFADYPDDAKNDHVRGRVEVELTLDANGDVGKAAFFAAPNPWTRR